MLGYYNYTVVLTYIGTLFGFGGILHVWKGDLKMSLIHLMIAGFCDMFDGKIASTMKRTKEEKRFGIQIDSLSDLICFGVLPALIVFQYTDRTAIHSFIVSVYVLCALIRLAWFNVDEEERQDLEEKSREGYLGLPVTAVAILLPVFIGILEYFKLTLENSSVFSLIIAAAFVLPIQIKKPGTIGKIILLLCGIIGVVIMVNWRLI